MPFLPPNQQRQSTEGHRCVILNTNWIINFRICIHVLTNEVEYIDCKEVRTSPSSYLLIMPELNTKYRNYNNNNNNNNDRLTAFDPGQPG